MGSGVCGSSAGLQMRDERMIETSSVLVYLGFQAAQVHDAHLSAGYRPAGSLYEVMIFSHLRLTLFHTDLVSYFTLFIVYFYFHGFRFHDFTLTCEPRVINTLICILYLYGE